MQPRYDITWRLGRQKEPNPELEGRVLEPELRRAWNVRQYAGARLGADSERRELAVVDQRQRHADRGEIEVDPPCKRFGQCIGGGAKRYVLGICAGSKSKAL